MHYCIGLTQWHHPDWYGTSSNSKKSLVTYAQHFSSVEGNNTFYGLPKALTVESWREAVSDDFRFCFKFPKAISHNACLQHCSSPVSEFLKLISPLEANLGVIWLQMSQRFNSDQLPLLQSFLESLPKDFSYGVEVRSLTYFDKADAEKRFNQLLLQHSVNRVMFDTRSLFANPQPDASTQDALQKKPRVPLHVLATGSHPMVRFISPMDTGLVEKELEQWASKVIQWIDEGRQPYIFFHTPDNKDAPALAKRFSEKVSQRRPDLSSISLWAQPTQQTNLF